MTLLVRPWIQADVEHIRHIIWESWMKAYSGFIPETDLRTYYDEHYSPSALSVLFTSPDVRGFMALSDGAPAGYARTTYNREQNRIYLTSIYVHPAFQGHGAGGLLLKEAEKVAASFGMDRIWLGVMTKNTEALDWYARIGFTFTERAPFTMGQTSVEHLIGWRGIASAGT